MPPELKDFDASRINRYHQQRFRIGGQEFTARAAVEPEALAPYFDLDGSTPELEALAIIDDTIRTFLIPEDRDRWAQVRSPELDMPLTISDMRDLLSWLIAAATGRPTPPPPGSGTPAGGIEMTSTDDSSRKEAVASPS